MPRYEVAVEGRELAIRSQGGGSRKVLGFHATLLVEAADPEAAETQALSRVHADPHVAAIAVAPPELAVDSVSEIPGANAALHGPIFCFFEAAP